MNRIKQIEIKLDKMKEERYMSFKTLFSKRTQKKLKKTMQKSIRLMQERNNLLTKNKLTN